MRALARYFGEDEELWGVVGLVHDTDYEKDPDRHPILTIRELEKKGVDEKITQAVRTHTWGYGKESPPPKSKMEWALYTCDELSGFIVACALVRPDKKLSSVTTEAVLKKWPQKAFARGVHREQIELCEEKLGIKLKDFISICLKAMQGISTDLGL